MNAIDTINAALFGNPPVASHKPSRAGVAQAFTELFNKVQTVEDAQGAGLAGYETLANVPSNLAANTVFYVGQDPVSANNGGYYQHPTNGPTKIFDFLATAIDSRLTIVETDTADHSTRIATLEGDTSTIASNTTRIDAIETLNVTQGDAITLNTGRLDAIEATDVAQGVTLTDYGNRITAAENTIVVQGDAITINTGRIDGVETDVADHETRIVAVEEKSTKNEKEIDAALLEFDVENFDVLVTVGNNAEHYNGETTQGATNFDLGVLIPAGETGQSSIWLNVNGLKRKQNG